jgi:imidazolonepropionase-like amidohydrolase
MAAILIALAGCAGIETPPRKVDLLIVGATAIDPATRAVMPNATMVIDDGVIVTVEMTRTGRYDGATTIDATGKFVIPAFVDMHVHWGNGTFKRRDDMVETTLARNLYYGVTRILNLGSNQASPREIDAFRAKLASGEWRGPKIYAAGAMITVPGSHPTTTIYTPETQARIAKLVAAAPLTGPIYLDPLAVTLVRSPDDMSREVARLAAWGADTIKIVIESGPDTFGNNHPQMSLNIARAAVETAHAANIRVLAHVSSLDDLETALAACADGTSHAITPSTTVNPKVIEQMRARGFFYTTTLTLYDGMLNWSADPARLADPFLRETLTDEEAAAAAPAEMFKAERKFFAGANRRETFAHIVKAYRAGATLLAGTDTGNPFVFPGYSLHEELRLLVEAGIPPMEALAAATHNPALYFREESKWGALAPGQRADLIILAANPLDDIRNTRGIVAVIQNGVRVDRKALHIH